MARCPVKQAKRAQEQPAACLVQQQPQAHRVARLLAPRRLPVKGCPARRARRGQARPEAHLAHRLLLGPRAVRLLASVHRASNAER